MKHTERIGAVMSGQFPDRTPYGVVTSVFGARLADIDLDSYYSHPGLYARGQAEVCALLDPDLIFGPFVLAYEAAAFGADVVPQFQAAPNIRKPAFDSVKTALAAIPPRTLTHPKVAWLLDSVKAMADMNQAGRLLVAPIIAPVDLPILLVGIEAWLDALLFDKATAAELLKRTQEHFKIMAEAYAAAGAQILASPIMMANPEILDEKSVRALLLPVLDHSFADLPVPLVFHHGGIRLADKLGLYVDLPKVTGFLLGELDSFAVARQILGNERLLLGNISGPHFDAYGVIGIRKRLEKLSIERRADPRWIFASSGAEVPWRTDPAVLSVVREFFQSGCL